MLLLFILVGFVVGTLGTLIGAGGGFLIVPLLMLAFHVPPAQAAGTSLVAVTVTAVIATIAFARQGKVDWKGGLFLSASGYPGTLLGAWVGTRVHPQLFSSVFGLLLLLLASWMIYRTIRRSRGEVKETASEAETAAAADPNGTGAPPPPRPAWCLCRRLVEAHGEVRSFCFFMPLAALFSFGIAFLGGMLGIGGGPVLVPAMIFALAYPVHVATATSPFIIALTAAGATAVHLHAGHVLLDRAAALSLGAVAGAPTGAWLNRNLNSRHLVLILSIVLLLLGLRLLIAGIVAR